MFEKEKKQVLDAALEIKKNRLVSLSVFLFDAPAFVIAEIL